MPDKISLFVPGRLCLFGEHSDWAGLQRVINSNIVPGLAIVTGIEQGIYADVEKSNKFIVHNQSVELQDTWIDFECPMQAAELRRTAAEDGYFSYVAGVASYINEHYHVSGFHVKNDFTGNVQNFLNIHIPNTGFVFGKMNIPTTNAWI